MSKIIIEITEPDIIDFFNSNMLIQPVDLISLLVKKYSNEKNFKESATEPIQINSSDDEIFLKRDLTVFFADHDNFITKKNKVLKLLKNSLLELNNITFDNFKEKCDTTFDISNEFRLTCEFCNAYRTNKKMSLAVHKRHCTKKEEITSSETPRITKNVKNKKESIVLQKEAEEESDEGSSNDSEEEHI